MSLSEIELVTITYRGKTVEFGITPEIEKVVNEGKMRSDNAWMELLRLIVNFEK